MAFSGPVTRSACVRNLVVLCSMLALMSCDVTQKQNEVGFRAQISVAEQFLKTGQYDQGYRILETVANDSKFLPEAQLEVGGAYLRSKAYLRAEQSFFRAAQLGNTVDARLGAGRIALARNNPSKARAAFLEVLAEDPVNLDARNGIGVSFDLDGKHFLAQEKYREVIALKPDYFKAINNLGLSLVLGGNAQAGAQQLTDLTSSKLDDATVRQNLALALAISGRETAAMKLATLDMNKRDAKQLFAAIRDYRRERN